MLTVWMLLGWSALGRGTTGAAGRPARR
jgi:hypothetical protein